MIPSILRTGVCLIVGCVAVTEQLSAQNLSLRDYSVIVKDDFTTHGNIDGRTVVGRNLTVNNSATFGNGLSGKISKTEYAVRVGGSLNSGNPLNLNAGSFEIAGTTNGRTINFNSGGSLVTNPSGDYRGLYNQLSLVSASLSSSKSNSSVSIPGSQPAAFKFTATPDSNGLAVFNISAADLFGNSKVQQIDLIGNNASNLLINVSGVSASFDYGNFGNGWNDYYDKVVWNFYEAETINLNSKQFQGLILAPNADVSSSGQIRGTVVAENFTSTGSVTYPGYNGTILDVSTTPVPEPGAVLLGLSSLTFLLILRRR